MKLRWLFGWFLDVPLFWKLFLCFFLMVLSLGGIAYYVNSIIAANQEELGFALKARSLRNEANTMRIAMLTLALMTTGDPAEVDKEKKDIETSTEHHKKLMAELEGHFKSDHDDEGLQMLKQLESVTADYDTLRDDQLAAILQHNVDAVKDQLMGVQRDRYLSMRKMAADLAKHAEAVSARRGEQAKTMFFIVIGSLAVLSLLMSFVLGQLIAKPIARLQHASAKMARGDLDVWVDPVDSRDEIGGLTRTFIDMLQSWQNMANIARKVNEGDLTQTMPRRGDKDIFSDAFNALVQNVAVITGKFKEAVGVVGTAAEEILVSVKESAAGATQTATAATQTTAIVEEVRQTSHVASQKAKQVSEGAQKTAQITAVGKKATEEIIEGMNRIREQVDLIAEAMVRLSEKSQSISSIISTVDDLAKQSNLLAVNASIEAARAGELGKGFGVVAQEVKSMAEQSKQSTAQVRSIIAEIQQATNAAAMATELGGKAVDAAMQQSGQAGESIAVLANSVVESAQAAAQIAVSNQQQLAGVDQVATAMASIRDACGEHLVAIRHVEAAANRLSEIGGKLRTLVDRYDVWDAGPSQGLIDTRR